MVDEKGSSLSEESEDQNSPLREDLPIGEQLEAGKRRRRKRIKVRKRVRIKKKINPRKKVKKLIETIIWIIAILAFVGTLIMLVMQLELKSNGLPKKKANNDKPSINHFNSHPTFYI